jgi:hypothetical protein
MIDLYFSMCTGTTFGMSKYQREKHTDLVISCTQKIKLENLLVEIEICI